MKEVYYENKYFNNPPLTLNPLLTLYTLLQHN